MYFPIFVFDSFKSNRSCRVSNSKLVLCMMFRTAIETRFLIIHQYKKIAKNLEHLFDKK